MLYVALASTCVSSLLLAVLEHNLPMKPTSNFYHYEAFLVLMMSKCAAFLSLYVTIAQLMYIKMRQCRGKKYLMVIFVGPVAALSAMIFGSCAVLLPMCDLIVHEDDVDSKQTKAPTTTETIINGFVRVYQATLIFLLMSLPVRYCIRQRREHERLMRMPVVARDDAWQVMGRRRRILQLRQTIKDILRVNVCLLLMSGTLLYLVRTKLPKTASSQFYKFEADYGERTFISLLAISALAIFMFGPVYYCPKVIEGSCFAGTITVLMLPIVCALAYFLLALLLVDL